MSVIRNSGCLYITGFIFVLLLLNGCKIRVEVPVGGKVVTESGAYKCLSGRTCTINVDSTSFDETFIALPAKGYRFSGWKKVKKGLCGGQDQPCSLTTTGFPGYDVLISILESDAEFYLIPVFASKDGPQLWTELVRGDLNPWNLIDFNNALYFTAEDGQSALWRSDGTAEGTDLFKMFAPDQWGGDPAAFVVADDRLFFRGTDYENGTELWVSDGTLEGTGLTRDIWPGDGRGLLSWPEPFQDGVLFIADDGMSGPQFWISDGTETGTRRFMDPAISTEAGARNFWRFKDGWLFKAQDPVHGAELWRTDGTEGNSQLVRDIVPGPDGAFTLEPFSFAQIGDFGVFWAWREGSPELWCTDGTEEGTRKIWTPPDPDLTPDYRLISYRNMALFFLQTSNLNDWSLWRTDGTKAGTTLLKEGFLDTVSPGGFIEYDGLLYLTLTSNDQVNGNELWRTDGTKAGTKLFVDLYPGAFSSSPYDLTIYADRLYFTATDETVGEELFRTDGTAEGTELVMDIRPGPESSSPNELTVSQGRLFFHAVGPNTGEGLYRTTSTP